MIRSSHTICLAALCGLGGGDELDDAVRAAPATRGAGPIDDAVRRDHPGDRGDVRDAARSPAARSRWAAPMIEEKRGGGRRAAPRGPDRAVLDGQMRSDLGRI